MAKFIERDERGGICAAYSSAQYPSQASLPDNDSMLLRYLNSTPLGAKLAVLDLTIDDLAQVTAAPAGTSIVIPRRR